MRISDWSSDVCSSDLLIALPTQAIIPPGATQAFRIQYIGDPEVDHSRHYYAEVAQLPVEIPGGQSTIQILYNFQAMVNVASITAGAPDLSVESAETVRPDQPAGAAPAAPPPPARTAFPVPPPRRPYGYLRPRPLTLLPPLRHASCP